MAAPNPIQVQKYLSGIDYPASKDDIVATAEKESAPDETSSRPSRASRTATTTRRPR